MNYPHQQKWQKSEHNLDTDNEPPLIQDQDQITNEPNLYQNPMPPRARPPAYVTLTGFLLLIVILLSIWGLAVYLP